MSIFFRNNSSVVLTKIIMSDEAHFHLSGYVPDEDLPGLLRSAVLPVAPHEHLSASGSINTWIGAGRRPLVPRSGYALELLERAPGCVWLYDDLRTALRQAWAARAAAGEPDSIPPPGGCFLLVTEFVTGGLPHARGSTLASSLVHWTNVRCTPRASCIEGLVR